MSEAVYGPDWIDREAREKFNAFAKAQQDMKDFIFSTHVDQDQPNWKHLSFHFYKDCVETSLSLNMEVAVPLREKFCQSENRREDLIKLSWYDFQSRWKTAVSMAFLGNIFDKLKDKYKTKAVERAAQN